MRLLFATAALIALAGPVYAQNASSGSLSGANAGAASEAGSSSAGGNAGATINYAPVTNYPSATSSTVTENGTLRTNTQAPDVVISGANACGLPLGASTSILGFGFAAGATPTDKGCERRDDAAALHALGHDDVSMAIMCESPDVANAMNATGHACPPVNGGSAPPIAATQPMPTGDMNTNLNNEVAATPAPVADYVSQHESWCKTLNPDNPHDVPYIQWDCRTSQ
jgi:hypothetical protein